MTEAAADPVPGVLLAHGGGSVSRTCRAQFLALANRSRSSEPEDPSGSIRSPDHPGPRGGRGPGREASLPSSSPSEGGEGGRPSPPGPRVLVVTQGTTDTQVGPYLVRAFRELGASEVAVLDHREPEYARRQIAEAELIWLSSGDQNRLVETLGDAGLVEPLKRHHARGIPVGGVSAGAAALPVWMIRGDGPDPATGSTHVGRGLGLWPGVILDQHVLARSRLERLRRAVRDRGGHLGLGLDEGAYVVVRGGRLEVFGTGAVVIVDRREGADETDLLLWPGMSYHGVPGAAGPRTGRR